VIKMWTQVRQLSGLAYIPYK